jgi:hypothetical protein
MRMDIHGLFCCNSKEPRPKWKSHWELESWNVLNIWDKNVNGNQYPNWEFLHR